MTRPLTAALLAALIATLLVAPRPAVAAAGGAKREPPYQFGTRHAPHNRPISDWVQDIRDHYAVKDVVDYAATRDLQNCINDLAGYRCSRWGQPARADGYAVFKQNSYVIYYAQDGDPEYRIRNRHDTGFIRCPLDVGKHAGIRVPKGASIWDNGLRRTVDVTSGLRTATDDIHFTIVDRERNRMYGTYSGKGSTVGVTPGGAMKFGWAATCDLWRGDDAAILAASSPLKRFSCRGGMGQPAAACGLSGIGAGIATGSRGQGFGNGDSNAFMGGSGVVVPQDFDDSGWTGEAVGTFHHALRCSLPGGTNPDEGTLYGAVWPTPDQPFGVRKRNLRNGQIIRLSKAYDIEANTGGEAPTPFQLGQRRFLRTLRTYGCVISDYATYGPTWFMLADWPGTGPLGRHPTHGKHRPWSAEGGANAEAVAFAEGQDARGVKEITPANVYPYLEVILPHGSSRPRRAP